MSSQSPTSPLASESQLTLFQQAIGVLPMNWELKGRVRYLMLPEVSA